MSDVRQEAMEVVGRRLPSFVPRPGLSRELALRAWLYSICVHKVTDYRRAVPPAGSSVPLEEAADVPADVPDPQACLSARHEAEELFALIEMLTPERRDVVLALLAGDRPMREIAEELSIPEGTASTRLRKATADLRAAYLRRRRRDRAAALPCWLVVLERACEGRRLPHGAAALLAGAALACLGIAFTTQRSIPQDARAAHVDPAQPSLEPPPAPLDATSRQATARPSATPAGTEGPRVAPSSIAPATPRTVAAGSRGTAREDREERAFLAKAQEAIAAGRRADAHAALDMHRRRFPNSALSDLRERLAAKAGPPPRRSAMARIE